MWATRQEREQCWPVGKIIDFGYLFCITISQFTFPVSFIPGFAMYSEYEAYKNLVQRAKKGLCKNSWALMAVALMQTHCSVQCGIRSAVAPHYSIAQPWPNKASLSCPGHYHNDNEGNQNNERESAYFRDNCCFFVAYPYINRGHVVAFHLVCFGCCHGKIICAS